MRQNPFNQNEPTWVLPPRGDKVFSVRISRNTLIAFVLSVLLHALLLWIFAPKLFSMGAPQKESPPFEITLGPPAKKEVATTEQILPAQQPSPERLPEQPKQKPAKTKPKKSVPPKQIKPVVAAKDSTFEVPETKKEPELNKKVPAKALPKETSPDPLPGEDMQAYIKRQKEASLAKQGASKQDIDEVLASNNPQSAGDKRDSKIKENLKFDGTNGIFVIRELGLRSAQFSFKGWKNNINNARLEIIDVKVADGGDVQRAIIRKMIEIIRREYSGDFQWDSWRQNRVLTLSARPEDTDALESFMLGEFFTSDGRLR